jgi:hypothetical protein
MNLITVPYESDALIAESNLFQEYFQFVNIDWLGQFTLSKQRGGL